MKNKDDTELNKIRVETSRMLADMEHNIKQEMHWEAQQKQWTVTHDEQSKHWEAQRRHWIGVVIIASIAMAASPFLAAIAKSYFI